MTAASDFTEAVRALTAALRQALPVADAIRLLPALAAQAGPTITGALCRRIAVVEACRASASYQPASYDEAAALRAMLCELLDVEIIRAGDEGEDATWRALRRLLAAVVRDLTARGASLAPLVEVRQRRSLPSLVLANRLYQDAEREAELVARVDPRSPLFMPMAFTALAR